MVLSHQSKPIMQQQLRHLQLVQCSGRKFPPGMEIGQGDDFTTLVQLGTDDLVFIGYPTVNGRSSNVISAMEACMITSFCEDPDAAWDVIRCLFTPPEQDTD